MSATTEPYTQSQFSTDLSTRIGNAIRKAFTGRGAAKRVAQAADASHRSASAWLYGQNAPRSPELIALMAANEALEQEIISMVHAMRERG